SKIVLEFHLYRIGQEHHPVRRIEGEYADLPLQLGSRLLIRIGGLEAAQIRDRELRFNRIQIIDRIDRQLAVRAGYLVRSAGDGSKRTDRHVRKPDRKLRFELDRSILQDAELLRLRIDISQASQLFLRA